MKFFKSPEERFLGKVEKEFGPWIRATGWTIDPSQSRFSGMASWVVYHLGPIRLRLMSDRRSTIVLEVAPGSPTDGWFDTEWHWLSGVLAWQQTGAVRGKDLRPSPTTNELVANIGAIVRFCSPEGAAERERYVEHMTWPPA